MDGGIDYPRQLLSGYNTIRRVTRQAKEPTPGQRVIRHARLQRDHSMPLFHHYRPFSARQCKSSAAHHCESSTGCHSRLSEESCA